MCRSTKANELGIDNLPNTECQDNLYWFVENVLDPIREIYGHPIKVNSGFRCKSVNRAVGGDNKSYHLNGLAADITPISCNGITWSDFLHAAYHSRHLSCFSEYIDIVEYGTFIHVEFDARRYHNDNPTKDFRLLTI